MLTRNEAINEVLALYDEMDNSPLMDEELGHRALRYCPSCGAEVE